MTALVAQERRTTSAGAPIAVLTLENPPINLMTLGLLHELNAAVTALAGELSQTSTHASPPRAVILSQGNSRAFCAGSDMNEFAEVAESPAASKVLLENHLLRSLAQLPVPVVAAIDGPALGGGLELALACDLRICGRSAQLGVPESRIGGLAGTGSQRLTKLVGPGRAKEMLFTGCPVTAQAAADWGLVNRVVDDGTALEHVLDLVENMTRNAPRSLALSKQLVDAAVDLPLDAGLAIAVTAQEAIFATADLHEGARSFRERRTARFVGR